MDNDWKSRSRRVLGDDGLEKLESSHVAVFGLGGVGSACAEALVRGGIGSFLFVDRDEVEPSNLNRQALAFISTLGMRKVDAMRKLALDINPDARIDTLDAFVKRETIHEQLAEFPRPDFMVDAFDTLTAKVGLALYAQEEGIPIISAMGSANKVDPSKYEYADLFDTHICPMCREMRKIARDSGVEKLPVVYSCEHALKVEPQEGAERSQKTELGTFSYMPPIMGQMMAGFVIQNLLKE